MTRKDYILLAGSFAQARQATEIGRNAKDRETGIKAIRLAAIGTATALLSDNPRFDRERFMSACGF